MTTNKLPNTITICENQATGFDKAAVLVRAGYTFSRDDFVSVFPDGVCSMVLTIGSPPDAAVQAAEAAKAEALLIEEAEFERRVQAAAKQLVEDQGRAAKQKEIDAVKADLKKQVARLEKELASH